MLNMSKIANVVSCLCAALNEKKQWDNRNVTVADSLEFWIELPINGHSISIQVVKMVRTTYRIYTNNLYYEITDSNISEYCEKVLTCYETRLLNQIAEEIRHVKAEQPQPHIDTDAVQGYPC